MLALLGDVNVDFASSFDGDERTVNTICHICKLRDEIKIADHCPQSCAPVDRTSIGRVGGRPFGSSRLCQPYQLFRIPFKRHRLAFAHSGRGKRVRVDGPPRS